MSQFDLEEQEQLDRIKAFWAANASWILTLVIVASAGVLAWNGWTYWQRKQSVQAAVLYDEFEQHLNKPDLKAASSVFDVLKKQFSNTSAASQTGLELAQKLHAAHELEQAQTALQWVAGATSNDATRSLAQLRIAGLAMDMQALDVAQDWLNRAYAPEFAGLQQDRLGDLAILKKDMKKAVEHYTKAKSLLTNDPYLPIVDAKLSAYAVEQP